MVGKGTYPGLTETTGHCFGPDPCSGRAERFCSSGLGYG